MEKGHLTFPRLAVLLIIGYLTALVAALASGPKIVHALLPLLRWEVTWLAPRYRVDAMEMARLNGEDVVRLRVEVPTGGIQVPAESSTLVGNALQPLIAMACMLMTAALARGRGWFFLIAGPPAAMAVLMADVPVVLVGAVDDVVASATASPAAATLVVPMNILNAGGRIALGAAAALLLIAAERSLSGIGSRRAHPVV
jgi:hypothetical protein